MARGRKPSVRYWDSRGGYCCWINGRRELLAKGPKDAQGRDLPCRHRPFLELWRYCYSVLYDLVELAGKTREELKQHRKDLRTAIGIVNDGG